MAMSCLLFLTTADPVVINHRYNENACTCVYQQPPGLLQLFTVWYKRQLAEEAAGSSECHSSCYDGHQEV